MTEEKILDGNKLIAEFMGAKYNSKLDLVNLGANHKLVGINELQYHSSWDWIMPVVEKIHSDTDFWVTIYYRSCKVFPMNIGVEMEILIEEKPTIEAVWIAVVEFIKWHNNEQTKC